MSNEFPTIQAAATLFAIVLGGTDSLLNIQLKNGFKKKLIFLTVCIKISM